MEQLKRKKNQSLLVAAGSLPSSWPSYYDVLNLLFWYEITVLHPSRVAHLKSTGVYKPLIANLLSIEPKLVNYKNYL